MRPEDLVEEVHKRARRAKRRIRVWEVAGVVEVTRVMELTLEQKKREGFHAKRAARLVVLGRRHWARFNSEHFSF